MELKEHLKIKGAASYLKQELVKTLGGNIDISCIQRGLEIIDQFSKSNVALAQQNCVLLKYLNNHLRLIKRKNLESFKLFRKRLFRERKLSDFYSLRYEIFVAHNLCSYDLKYGQPDPPDFEVHLNDEVVFLECGSCQLTSQSFDKDDLKYKLESVINKKSNHNYAHNLALYVEISNISISFAQDKSISIDFIDDFIMSIDNFNKFGSVITHTVIRDDNDAHVKYLYSRTDHQNISKSLVEVLSKINPKDNRVIFDNGSLFQVAIPESKRTNKK